MEKKILFPEFTKWEDVFEETTDKDHAPEAARYDAWEFRYPKRGNGKGRKVNFYIPIGPYCGVSGNGGYRSVYVKARPEVVEAIKNNMIAAGVNDRITFEAVTRDDGSCLIVAQNSQIISSWWIACFEGKVPEV